MNIKKKLIQSEENLEELTSKLNELFIFLDDVYYINSGGCCLIASYIAELLERDGIPFSVIVYDCDAEDFNDIDCSHFHYALRIAEPIINPVGERYYSEYINVSSLILKEHYYMCDWNDAFNVLKGDFIKNEIESFYYDFTENLREEL